MPRLFPDLLKQFDEKCVRGPAASKVEKKPKRLSRRKPERRKDDDEYNRISDLYKEQTRACAYCGRRLDPSDLQNDHIVSGTSGRAASQLHFDTWNTTCAGCHRADPKRAVKAAAKLIVVLRTIERLQRRNFGEEETKQILAAVKNRKAGYSR